MLCLPGGSPAPTSVEQKGWDSRLPSSGARSSRPVRLWCFFRIFTVAVYARMLQCTSSSTCTPGRVAGW
jgi:hypothetical protein